MCGSYHCTSTQSIDFSAAFNRVSDTRRSNTTTTTTKNPAEVWWTLAFNSIIKRIFIWILSANTPTKKSELEFKVAPHEKCSTLFTASFHPHTNHWSAAEPVQNCLRLIFFMDECMRARESIPYCFVEETEFSIQIFPCVRTTESQASRDDGNNSTVVRQKYDARIYSNPIETRACTHSLFDDFW